MLTIRPQPASIIAGITALQGRKVPTTLTSSTKRKSSTPTFWAGVSIGPITPAVLTRMSILPNRSSVAAGEHHGRSLLGQRAADRPPHPLRGAGHDRHPAVQLERPLTRGDRLDFLSHSVCHHLSSRYP